MRRYYRCMSRLNPKIYRGQCSSGCGNPIFSKSCKAKYCSLKCATARYRKKDGEARLPCLNGCGRFVTSGRKKYCCFACQQDYQFKIRCLALEAGLHKTFSSNRFIRKYLVSRFGERCFRCGWNARHALTGRVPVEVEHIDGNWQNNHPSNLTLICPNCHSLTSTFRGLNRGKGRPYRLGGRANPIRTGPHSKEQKSRVAKLPGVVDPSGHLKQLPLFAPT
jgi:hypothetical protein